MINLRVLNNIILLQPSGPVYLGITERGCRARFREQLNYTSVMHTTNSNPFPTRLPMGIINRWCMSCFKYGLQPGFIRKKWQNELSPVINREAA